MCENDVGKKCDILQQKQAPVGNINLQGGRALISDSFPKFAIKKWSRGTFFQNTKNRTPI